VFPIKNVAAEEIAGIVVRGYITSSANTGRAKNKTANNDSIFFILSL
jgi:hypothetical protein